ncbi:universal stress protein [Salinarchaeum sp. IM2453]|uniref:universal stress protein n=1 Tax=Salinarchaeum sp. IM2453 TaxID=2862870 RepID=UPI001C830137|nr:universal stress protein [Salinarchaeum sp. IM2453]QZA89273.1 universal stress protein [Salinarchaeum sp. IM2453]
MRVLVPIDGSDPAEQALQHAVDYDPDAVVVIHVIDPAVGLRTGEAYTSYDQFLDAGKQRANSLFARASEIVPDELLETDTVIGSPAREIVSYAEENDIDQIVLGSHGRSGISRILLGSVAEGVTRRAPVPVTVVR